MVARLLVCNTLSFSSIDTSHLLSITNHTYNINLSNNNLPFTHNKFKSTGIASSVKSSHNRVFKSTRYFTAFQFLSPTGVVCCCLLFSRSDWSKHMCNGRCEPKVHTHIYRDWDDEDGVEHLVICWCLMSPWPLRVLFRKFSDS